jgi:basic membrane protein A and related proteins
MQLRRFDGFAAGALALALTLTLAACGSDTTTTGGDSGSGKPTASTDCGYGIVFPTPIGPNQSSRALEAGFKQAAAAAGKRVTIVESSDEQSFLANLTALAAKHCYSAIGTMYFTSSTALAQVAKQFPSQKLFIIDGFVNAPSVTNFAAAPEQLTYIAGAMAAQLSKSKKIGIVLGDNEPSLLRFGNGFSQGAKLIDPAITVKTSFVGSFTDPAKSATLAVAQASQGVDLVYPASGSNLEIYAQGKRNGYQSIASDPTEYAQAKAKGADIAFVAIIDQQALGKATLADVIDGKAKGGAVDLGLADGVFDVPGVISGSSPYPLSAAVLAAGKRAYDGLKSGQLTVKDPTGS